MLATAIMRRTQDYCLRHWFTIDAAHNSRNSLDWQGTYAGTLPCASCEGIRTTLTLAADGTFTRELAYLGEPGAPVNETGAFTWNDAGSAITLASGSGQGQQYQVGENRLWHLDRSGNRIAGDLANRYVLDKTVNDPRIENRRWLLTEVAGQPVALREGQSEAYILLDSALGRVSGNGSCNKFFGGYLVLGGNRIRFDDNLGATMMACPDMEIERALFEVLGKVDNYAVDKDRLTLNRARMAPLLVFSLANDGG
jgi:heat shock protein HslJ